MTQKLISIYGIRRSGNHAVANWIMSHFNNGCYINDANKKVREQSNKLPCHDNNCINVNLYENPEITIIGIENKVDRHIHKIYLEKLKSDYQYQNLQTYEFCLIRNCANLIASHLKAWGDQSYHEKIPDHWKQYIDFYTSNNEINLLIYDRWLDNDYRNKIANIIKFNNQDLGIEQIPWYGGGSSFNEKVINKYNLKNRWKSMINNERFIKIIKNFMYWKEHANIFGQDETYTYFNTN